VAVKREAQFAEVAVDRLLMESFANEASAYYRDDVTVNRDERYDRFRTKLKWHIARSLSPRQKQVVTLFLRGKKQREIAAILGITQQVVSIYKRRAINRLRDLVKT
jgi:RNA polymerase sigma factor (sigma-70 family)